MRNFIQHKISRQLTASVLAALALAGALYFTAQPLFEEAICRYYARHPNVVQSYTAQVLSSIQRYVRDHDVKATDASELSLWVRQYPLSVLHIYRGESLLYDSTRFDSSRLHTHAPTYSPSNNVSVHAIVFADGSASVSLTVFPEYGVIQRVNKVLLLIAGLVFLGFLLLCIQRKLRYFMRLEQEVLSIAGGSLQTPISVRGQDELARLAECIDEMRDSLVSKLRREEARQQESYEWVTSLSHDLRTPLTMLTGYLEILRRRQPTLEQLAYLDKACGKAAQLKDMSDLLFACFSPSSLQAGARVRLPAGQLRALLTERADLLAEKGHSVLVGDFPDAALWVHPDALKRVLDNVFSNLERYADPDRAADISAEEGKDQYRLCVRSASRSRPDAQGTGLGLGICQNLMANMRGTFSAAETDGQFVYCLSWELAPPAAQTKED